MSKIALKKSSVPGKVPLVTDLDYGELALNYADGKLYYKTSANAIGSISTSSGGSGGSGGGVILINRMSYTATAGQTTFNVQYQNGIVDVYSNGSRLTPQDYTANTGTSIQLVVSANAGDEIELVGYSGTVTNLDSGINLNNVVITDGSMDGVAIGSTTPDTGVFTVLKATDQIYQNNISMLGMGLILA